MTDPKPIENFELSRYLGKWHEQARAPNSFQKKKSTNTTAIYSLNEDNKYYVIKLLPKIMETSIKDD